MFLKIERDAVSVDVSTNFEYVLCFGGRGLEGSELFVSETIFEYLVKVMGIAYVFEKG